MNTRIRLLFGLVIWASPGLTWPQDAPTPLPPPAVVPAAPPQGAQVPYYAPPGAYAPPPGPVMAAPGQPYVYAPPGAYAGPMVVSPPAVVFVPAPPLSSYRWSVATEALFLERSSGGSVPLGYARYNPGSHLPPQAHGDNLDSDDAIFPLEAGLRLEVSRKFDNNMTLAATYWGLQQWSVGETIYGDSNFQTVLAHSPYLQLSSLFSGLDNSLAFTGRSQIENVEVNTLFQLGPYDPYWGIHWLWGVRYINFTERFALTGIDDLNGAAEQLDYHTTNDLLGAQTGVLFVRGWDRFQWETGLKFGLMANMVHQHGTDTASGLSGVPAGFAPYDISNNGSDLSALFEVSLAARIRLTNSLWFRLGYQFYDITGLALAPRQLRGFGHGGNLALDGLSLGLQATW